MATNATDDKSKEDVRDEDATPAEELLRQSKYESEDVENEDEESLEDEAADEDNDNEESEDDDVVDQDKPDDDIDEESEEDDEPDSEEDSKLVKKFPNIQGDSWENYAKSLEAAYENSTAEAIRLKRQLESSSDDSESDEDSDDSQTKVDLNNPLNLYMKQKMDEEIATAFSDFQKAHPQVNDPNEYEKFRVQVNTLSQVIRQSESRLAPPAELYNKAAVILGWEAEDKPNKKEELDMALKNKASSSKTTSKSKPKAKSGSKISDGEVALFRKLNPGTTKTDNDIREELEKVS